MTWALSAVCVRGQREEHEKGVSLVLSFSVFSAPPPSMTSVSTPKKILLQAFVLFYFVFKEKENERKKKKEDPVSFLQHNLLLQHFPQFRKLCPQGWALVKCYK